MIQPQRHDRSIRIGNPRAVRAATQRRKARKARARYVGITRTLAVLTAVMMLLMSYVVLTSSLTGLSYAVAKAQAGREALQEETMRLDDRIAALRSDDRLSQLAARLGMTEPHTLGGRSHRDAARRPRRAVLPGARRRSPDSSLRRWLASSSGRRYDASADLRARRPDAREALLLCVHDRRALSRLAPVRRAGAQRTALREGGAGAAFRHGRSLRAPRQHPGPQRQRPRALACRPRASTPSRARFSIPTPAAAKLRTIFGKLDPSVDRGVARSAPLVRLDRSQGIPRGRRSAFAVSACRHRT